MAPYFSVEDISLRFGGLQVLDDVCFHVDQGEIVGLIGPNGAGKTTLFDVISGFHRPVRGHIRFRDVDLVEEKPFRRAWLGLGRTFQTARLFQNETVLDVVKTACHRRIPGGAVRGLLAAAVATNGSMATERRVAERAAAIIDRLGLGDYANKQCSELSYGTLRLTEIATVLAMEPELVLLDEPSSGIAQRETEALGPLLLELREELGATFLIIEHDMPLVMGISDRIVALAAGQVLAEGRPEEIQNNDQVVEAYLGGRVDLEEVVGVSAGVDRDDLLLDIRGLRASYGAVEVLRSIDFTVARGEIVALLGTNGAGKSTILRCISGLMPADDGQILFEGEDLTRVTTEETVRLGVTQVPGGRGLLPNLSVEENLRMGAYPLRRDRAAVRAGYDRVYETFPRLAERRRQLAGLMSGGEQQMLAIGRALMLQPKLMMIDELSLGLAPLIVNQLVDVVRQINASGVSMILVEQSANLALSVTDHAYFIEKGQMRFDGSSRELLERDDLLRSVFLAAAK